MRMPSDISDPELIFLYRFQPCDGHFGLGTYQPCPVSVAVFLPVFKLIGQLTLPVGRLQRGYPDMRALTSTDRNFGCGAGLGPMIPFADGLKPAAKMTAASPFALRST